MDKAKSRITLGMIVLLLGQGGPFLVPVVDKLQVSATVQMILKGILMFAVPELFLIAAISIMGKQGYDLVKTWVFKRLKRIAPADTVSPIRYKIGLVMFVSVLVYGFVMPYIVAYLPGILDNPKIYAMPGDIILVASLFVLGGDFWDKLRALFVQTARVDFQK